MKNLCVYADKKYLVEKKNIHELVKNLANSLNFLVQSLDINIINSKKLLKVNVDYLGHNYDTDIITFNYSDKINILNGELLISYEMAVENAKRFNCSLNSELVRLIIHGILHMSGFDDMNNEDRKKMKRKENKLVKLFESIVILK
ncbi:MAG: rRNA maturation RNase YbeY [bacterium]